MNFKFYYCIILTALCLPQLQAQNVLEMATSINAEGEMPDSSAILDIQSTSQGVLFPRMTFDEISAIEKPALGLFAFDTDFGCLRMYDGSNWQCLYQQNGDPYRSINSVRGYSAGDTAVTGGLSIEYDSTGKSIILAGAFEDGAILDQDGIPSAGSADLFIAKYTTDFELEWLVTGGGSSIDWIDEITLASDGSIYGTGYFSDTLRFAGDSLISKGDADVFVIKMDKDGVIEWMVQGEGATGNDRGQDINLDLNGNIYVCGNFEGTIDFDTHSRTSNGDSDYFLVKIDPLGTVKWLRSGGSVNDDDVAYGVAIGPSNFVYVTGFLGDTTSIGTHTHYPAGSDDIFLTKYTPSGTVDTLVTIGGTDVDRGTTIFVDENESVYLGGNFQGTVTFDSRSRTALAYYDGFIVKLDSTLTPEWDNVIGCANGNAQMIKIIVKEEEVYLVSSMTASSEINNIEIQGLGFADILIAKLNSIGSLDWYQVYGHSLTDVGRDITFGQENELFATGYYLDQINFGSQQLLINGEGPRLFIAQIKE